MPSPFPGMDPYLEDPHIWPGFHQSLAVEIMGQLNAMLGQKYYADLEVWTIERRIGIDIPIITPAPLRRAVVHDRAKLFAVRLYSMPDSQLVTSIEILSPFNKRPGQGVREYRQKRRDLLNSTVHLVELDLLRGGRRPGREVTEPLLDTDYVLLVNRYQPGDRISEIWPIAMNEPLPGTPIPLLAPDPDALLDLSAALRAVYARAAYERRIDYGKPVPPPPLRAEMAAWLMKPGMAASSDRPTD